MPFDDELSEVPSPSNDFDTYQTFLQKAAVGTTKAAMRLPRDLSFHRSLDRKFGRRLDACSARILSLTTALLEYAEATGTSSKSKEKRKLQSEEDIVDGFHLHVVDIMDQLLERTDTCLDEFLGLIKPAAIAVKPQVQPCPQSTRVSRRRLDPALAHASHIPKPQLLFRTRVENSDAPWRPQLKTKPHALIPLEESLARSALHPYQYEITHAVPPDHILEPPPPLVPPIPLTTSQSATYISHPEQLPMLLAALKDAHEIAVDLEHHSYRSFAGFVCLMQLSTRTHDWIVDCLDPDVRAELECLNEVFADPQIVKVFHGAESDIVWLQQNFNLYIVTLFDTYHATKVLGFPKHSLAALLEMYCDFTPDKRFQLADWRIRPLPEQMLLYACADTHFLLFIYDNLRRTLAASATAEVLRRSSETALRTYALVQNPGEWESLGRRWNRSLGGAPGAVFRAVHAWRENVARAEDESTRYVLANQHLFQLAERPPTDLAALFATFQVVPPLVRTRSSELLAVIQKAIQNVGAEGEPGLEEVRDVSAPLPSVEPPSDHVRIAGHGAAGLWDRLLPTATPGELPHTATSSSLLGITSTPPVPYSASKSALFGKITRGHTVSDSRYHALVARIHATLVVAPTPKLAISHPEAPIAVSVDGSSEVPTSAPTSSIALAPTPDPTVQAEISFVPRAQRLEDPGIEEGIVVVGRQKKRKRHDASASGSKKHKGTGASPVPDFDYAAAPNILDEPTPIPTSVPRAKKKQEKGGGGGVQYGSFRLPPRNRSEMKSGNQARTFR